MFWSGFAGSVHTITVRDDHIRIKARYTIYDSANRSNA
jgi:hypothetical protein